MRLFGLSKKSNIAWSTLSKRKSHTKAYVTTPIYYVNAVPHIGHLYSSVLSDTIKRHYLLRGQNSILSTGTDENGLKIQQAAENNKTDPRIFCDNVSETFKKLAKAANIDYVSFQRTTSKDHVVAVNELWNQLVKSGYIYKGKHEGWYAVSDEAFYTVNQVHKVKDEKTGKEVVVAIESGQQVEWTTEENYKFKLSLFKDDILKWIHSDTDVIVPNSRKKEVISYLEGDIPDLSVSRLRSRLHWGIQVPNDPDHTIYVWLDALTNYLTATGYPWKEDTSLKDAFPPNVQVVGKDIVRFHAVYWPAFLMAAGLPLPKQLLVHAHWTMQKKKMSKSRGNVADPFKVLEAYGVDPVRYYLVRNGGIEDDSDYSEEMIRRIYSKDLVGQLGNLFNRATSNSLLPDNIVPVKKSMETSDKELDDILKKVATDFDNAFEKREFNKAFSHIFNMLAEANKYFTMNKPWELVKKTDGKDRLETVLSYSLESCRVAAILLQPVMPQKMEKLLNELGVPLDERYLEHAKSLSTFERKLGKRDGVLFPMIK